jgi:hypothetical protein
MHPHPPHCRLGVAVVVFATRWRAKLRQLIKLTRRSDVPMLKKAAKFMHVAAAGTCTLLFAVDCGGNGPAVIATPAAGALAIVPSGEASRTANDSYLDMKGIEDSETHLTYVAQNDEPYVSAYPQDNKQNKNPVCLVSLKGSIQESGVGVDFSNNLWVLGVGRGAQEYAPNCGRLVTYISDPDGPPNSVAFDKHGGVYLGHLGGYLGKVTIGYYPAGSRKPTKLLLEPRATYGGGIALDGKDNLYLAWSTAGSSSSAPIFNVSEFRPNGSRRILLHSLPYVYSPFFDHAENLVLLKAGNPTDLLVFSRPYGKMSPVTMGLHDADVGECQFNHLVSRLFCISNGTAVSVDVYSYDSSPPKAQYLYSWSADLGSAIGVAVSPRAPN